MPARRVTSSDVARAAGLSRAAVSLVLNGRADGEIEAEKQELVRRIARDLGYRPNRAAVSLRRQSTATIGLVTDGIASAPFAGPLITGASHAATAAGYMVLTIDTEFHADYVEGAVETLRNRDVDGLIYAAAGVREVRLPDAVHQLPTVLANAFAPDGGFPAWIPDDRAGEEAATKLAIDAGHRRITYLTGDLDSVATTERIAGFQAAMRDAGLVVDASSLVHARYSTRSHYDQALRVLSAPDRPTALLCANDRGALGAILAAISLGLNVPGDVSIIGYDDERGLAADVAPALTTVALPHDAMGHAAASYLLEMIRAGDEPVTPPETVRLACVPVVRESLGRVPMIVNPARA